MDTPGHVPGTSRTDGPEPVMSAALAGALPFAVTALNREAIPVPPARHAHAKMRRATTKESHLVPGMNLTRDEARERARVLSVDSYDIALDLTTGDSTFRSTSVIRFACSEPGAS